MHPYTKNHTQEEKHKAPIVDIQTAIELCEARDWETYRATRDVLFSLMRAGRSEEVSPGQMQFLMFVTTHLRSKIPLAISDQRIFFRTFLRSGL